MDVRSTRQVEEHGSDEIHRLTGKPPDTTPALYKLLWLREHEPETLERTRWVADVHAFLVQRLTGTWRTTTACADPLGLVDMERRDWSDELLGRIGLSRSGCRRSRRRGRSSASSPPRPASSSGCRRGCRWSAAPATGSAPGSGRTRPGRAAAT